MPRLSVREAAKYLGYSVFTLNQLRTKGRGPRYSKPAGKIFYDTADLDKWHNDSLRNSTSDILRPKRPRGRPRKEAATGKAEQ
jgi:hypothetical protein